MPITRDEFSETASKVSEDFSAKLDLNASNGEFEADQDHEDDDDDDFSFVCNGNGANTSPISADDVFIDGQIRPIYPLFNRYPFFSEDSVPSKNDLPLRPPVQKVFIEAYGPPPPPSSSTTEADEVDSAAAGPYCTWSKKAIEASPEVCKKSNSTGFSKLWKFRDLGNRSNSEGRDAFVFLNSSTKVEKREGSLEKRIAREGTNANSDSNANRGKAVNTKKGGKRETASRSAHELHYVRNRALRESDRRRSYLPYRPELVGFFTNINGGLSRNVHPF